MGLQSTVLLANDAKKIYESEFEKFERFLPSSKNVKMVKLKKLLEDVRTENIFTFMPVFYAVARKL